MPGATQCPRARVVLGDGDVLGVEWWHPCPTLTGYQVQYGANGQLDRKRLIKLNGRGGPQGTAWVLFLPDMQQMREAGALEAVRAQVRVRMPTGEFSRWSEVASWPEPLSRPHEPAAPRHRTQGSRSQSRPCEVAGRDEPHQEPPAVDVEEEAPQQYSLEEEAARSPGMSPLRAAAGRPCLRTRSSPPLPERRPISREGARVRADRANSTATAGGPAASAASAGRRCGGSAMEGSAASGARPRSDSPACRHRPGTAGLDFVLGTPPRSFHRRADTACDECRFHGIYDQGGMLVGLLAEPPVVMAVQGLILTCPGAGGGPGPSDPEGNGGGGTYGGYCVYRRLAAEMPRHGFAVLLVHYPDGFPGGADCPRGARVGRVVSQADALARWFHSRAALPDLPAVILGWSMGGAVAIELAAKALHARAAIGRLGAAARMQFRGVATIASQTAQISATSPRRIVGSGAELLVMHGLADDCLKPACARRICDMAGRGLEPLLFPDEDHGVESALGVLADWVPRVLLGQ